MSTLLSFFDDVWSHRVLVRCFFFSNIGYMIKYLKQHILQLYRSNWIYLLIIQHDIAIENEHVVSLPLSMTRCIAILVHQQKYLHHGTHGTFITSKLHAARAQPSFSPQCGSPGPPHLWQGPS